MAVLISVLAFLFSAFTFAHNRRAGRRDLLLKVHEQFLSVDQQNGRRLLYEMAEKGLSPTEWAADDFREINHAVASLDILGYLYERRYIARRDALDLWAPSVGRVFGVAESTGFLSYRRNQYGRGNWPYLRSFAEAIRHHLSEGQED